MWPRTILSMHVVLALCLFAPPVRAADEAPSSQPTGPATHTGPRQAVRAAMDIDNRLTQMMSAVRDGSEEFRDNAMYLLMARLQNAPALADEDWSRLDRPAIPSLIEAPDRYRLEPIRLTVRVYAVQPRSAAKDTLDRTGYWPADRTMYEILCVSADPPTKAEQDALPLRILAAEPPAGLPEPRNVNAAGLAKYPTGPTYEVAGVFFKLTTGEGKGSDAQPKQQWTWPVVLAWQFRTAASAAPPRDVNLPPWLGPAIAAGIAVVLVLGFYAIRKRVMARMPDSHTPKYKPLRDEAQSAPPADSVEGPVDPDLAAAAEERRREQDPTDAPEPTND